MLYCVDDDRNRYRERRGCCLLGSAQAPDVPGPRPGREADAVIVKITTTEGLSGYGESYNARAPLAVVQTVNTTLRELLAGLDAMETVGIWNLFETRVLANHGTCAACVFAMSGVDMALWDLNGKALGLPIYSLLGGSAKAVPGYAGGLARVLMNSDRKERCDRWQEPGSGWTWTRTSFARTR